MPPKGSGNEAFAKAINLKLGGMDTRKAWVAAGMPGSKEQTALDYIRAAARGMKKTIDVAASNADALETSAPASGSAAKVARTSAVTPVVRKNNEQADFRLNVRQVDKAAAAKHTRKRAFIDVLKPASLEYSEKLATESAPNSNAIARRFNEKLPDDVQKLEGWRIRHHVAQGMAGLSPPHKGPKPVVPDVVVSLVSTHTSMSQLNGNELKPRALTQNLLALVNGSTLQQHLKSKQQRSRFLKRLRQLLVCGASLSAVPKVLCDNRRWMWLTYLNVDTYFTGWKYFVITIGFADDVPEVQPDGSTAEVTFSDYMKRRTSCGDETHQRLANMGDKSGSRATTYVNPLIVRSGSRKVECAKHITSYILVNGFDEVGPYTAIFDTSCTDEEDRQLNVGWTAGLPRVNCQFGFSDVVTCEPIVIVTPKGGTCEDALEKILELAVIPLSAPIHTTAYSHHHLFTSLPIHTAVALIEASWMM